MPIKVSMDTSADGSAPEEVASGSPRGGSRRRRWLRPGRRRDERGATLVEYALLVAVFAIPTMTAIHMLQDVSRATIEDTAARISSRAAPGDGG